MTKDLKFLIFSSITFIFLCGIHDLGMIRTYKTLIKDSLDLSTKAAALQLDEDKTKIGNGVFEIDEDKAKKVNKDIFIKNLNENLYNLVVDTEVINVHHDYDYIAPNNKKYLISDPTIFSVVKFKYKGILFDKDIEVQLLSGSTLKNKNDLKNKN